MNAEAGRGIGLRIPHAASPLRVFRASFPHGNNYLVSPISTPTYRKIFCDLEVKVSALAGVVG